MHGSYSHLSIFITFYYKTSSTARPLYEDFLKLPVFLGPIKWLMWDLPNPVLTDLEKKEYIYHLLDEE